METNLEALRDTISKMLIKRGQVAEFCDQESLFDSGMLDSLSAVNLMLQLEAEFSVDIADPEFDISHIDTFADIRQIIAQAAA